MTAFSLPPAVTETIQAGKDWVWENLRRGVECPLCTQHVELYSRPLTREMVHVLAQMYHDDPYGWLYMPDVQARLTAKGGVKSTGGDPLKLRYWGLIERQEGEREDGSTRTGWWRLTEKGRQFAREEIPVPKVAWVFANEAWHFSGPEVTIRDRWGRNAKFRLDEIRGPL